MKVQQLVLLLAVMSAIANTAHAQVTAFTYQGRLTDGANSVNGQYDLRFTLYNAPVGGSQAGVTYVSDNVAVSNGLFTTSIDFGASVFNGTACWLEIAVRPGASTGSFTLLDPRQPLTPAPLAIFSHGADTLDGLDSSAFASAVHTHNFGQITGNVADHQLSANVARLSSGATFNGPVTANGDLQGMRLIIGTAHGLTGGRASIVGGLNNTNNGLDSTIGGGFRNWIQSSADDVVIAGGRENTIGGLAYYAAIGGGVENVVEINSPSAVISGGELNVVRSGATHAVIGGGLWNEVGTNSPRSFIGGGEFNVIGTNSLMAAITGGSGNHVQDDSSGATISGGAGNHVLKHSPFATIGGGVRSTNSGWAATISGGEHNHARARWATVGGGVNNEATSDASTIAGGNHNRSASFDSTVGGGSDNTAAGFASTVPGGHLNRAQGAYSFAAGRRAKADHDGAHVWADSTDTDFLSAAVNEFAVRARGGVRIDSAGAGISLDGQPVLSGLVGTSQLADGAVTSAKIAGGSIIPGDISAPSFATTFWKADGNAGTVAGTHFIGTTDNRPLEFKVNGLRVLRLEDNGDGDDANTMPDGAPNMLAGSPGNFVTAGTVGGTIAGGGATDQEGFPEIHVVQADYGTVGGGLGNRVGSFATTIAGGHGNSVDANSRSSAIGGGEFNSIGADSLFGVVVGGGYNRIAARSPSAVIGGGNQNTIAVDSQNTTIAGGLLNIVLVNSPHSTIGGGLDNGIGLGSSSATIGGGWFNDIFTNAWSSVIGGGSNNKISDNAGGATIAGGMGNDIRTNSNNSTIGGGLENFIASHTRFGTIAGGDRNRLHTNCPNSTIGGGWSNDIADNCDSGTIAGGFANDVSTNSSFTAIAGGWRNQIGPNSPYSVIGGGFSNIIMNSSAYATIPGGRDNSATNHSFAAGRRAKANHTGSFVWADSTDADFTSSAVNEFAVRARGGIRIDSAGAGMSLDGQPVLSGLVGTSRLADGAVTAAKIAAGAVTGAHIANGSIIPGDINVPSFTTTFWKADGNVGTTPGTHFVGTSDNQPLEFRVNGQRALRLEPKALGAANVVGGSMDNFVAPTASGVTVWGGTGLGQSNAVFSSFATIGGGTGNAIALGAAYSTISGGMDNTVEDAYATVPGGSQNLARGAYSFAAGRRAKALHSGAFVWADSVNADYVSTTNNQFCIRAAGGMRLDNSTSLFLGNSTRQMVNLWDAVFGIGVQDFTQYYRSNRRFSWFLNGSHSNTENSPGAGGSVLMTLTSTELRVNGVFVSSSDRTRKERFESVNSRAVLEKVAALPISTWVFKDGAGERHMGPVAQDFHSAFGLGGDDRHIATVDADGVALAAIQGLNQKLESELRHKSAEIAELKTRLAKLEQYLMKALAEQD